MPQVDFYFDFVSPYAYLGWKALLARAKSESPSFSITPRPVLFAGLLDAHGQLGPAEIEAKRRFVMRDVIRFARKLGVPLGVPVPHPFRSLDALRLCLPSVAGEKQIELVDALFSAAWGRGENLESKAFLEKAIGSIGLDPHALVQRTTSLSAKDELRSETEAAVTRGVFGVPTFGVGHEIIFGADRLDDVIALVRGDSHALIDHATLERALKANEGAPRRQRARGASPIDGPTQERILAIFERAAFLRHIGVELVAAQQGLVEASIRVSPHHLQQDGFVHAGVLGTLCDHTAGAASATFMREGATPLTIEYKLNLLRPAKGDKLRCVSRVLRSGKRVAVAESEVFVDGSDKIVAKAMVTLAVVELADLAGE